MKKHLLLFILSILLASCSTSQDAGPGTKTYQAHRDTLTLFDALRGRKIPVAYYQPTKKKRCNRQIVILSHGYGQNAKNSYLNYSFLTTYLASSGYFVTSIQHELPTDALLPSAGIPQIVRKPFWERGANNISFVIDALKRSHPDLDFEHITLIGHSNGGDMSALFPVKYPGLIQKVITLDNRRMELPKNKSIRVLSLRSNDQPADAGVLPDASQQKEYGMSIIPLLHTPHNNMADNGTEAQRDEIRGYVWQFLVANP